MVITEDGLGLLRRRPDWRGGIAAIRRLDEAKGDLARHAADEYVHKYRDARASMVFDVVVSRQRKYDGARVQVLVAGFAGTAAATSLAALAADGPGDGWRLRRDEPATMQAVAGGLVRFAAEHGCPDDDATVRGWADATGAVVDAHQLDPYVGEVKGIGPALFAYLRMRSGGDGLKPDVRVRRGLHAAGFTVPPSDLALLRLAEGVAAEVDLPLLVLDQLLWHRPA